MEAYGELEMFYLLIRMWLHEHVNYEKSPSVVCAYFRMYRMCNKNCSKALHI